MILYNRLIGPRLRYYSRIKLRVMLLLFALVLTHSALLSSLQRLDHYLKLLQAPFKVSSVAGAEATRFETAVDKLASVA